MLQFRFRLEKLLGLRKYEEHQWELKLAKVVGECMMLQNKITANRLKIRQGTERRFTRGNLLDIDALIGDDLYIYRLYSEIDTMTLQLEAKNRERAEVSRQYMEHARKRKVLDKLKEKRAADYYKLELQEQFKEQDDIANSADVRKNVIG